MSGGSKVSFPGRARSRRSFRKSGPPSCGSSAKRLRELIEAKGAA